MTLYSENKMVSLRKTVCALLVSTLLFDVTFAADKPLRIYILAGQSNMEGHAEIRTFDYIGDDPKTAPMLKEMRGAGGRPRVCENVWISYLTGVGNNNGEGFGKLTAGYGSRGANYGISGSKIGPEFTFGIYMRKTIRSPILIVKTAWGGKSLHTDFRPPSAGPYIPSADDTKRKRYVTEEQKQELDRATGRYYRLMIEHVKRVTGNIKRVYPDYDEAQGYEIDGFVWFQGWNDMVARNVYPRVTKDHPIPRFNKYSNWMADFIRDVRNDLEAPEMKFVIGVMGVDGVKNVNEGNTAFRQAMALPASFPEFQGNVAAVQTGPYWDEALGAIDAKLQSVRQMAYLLRTKNPKEANKDGSMSKEEQRDYVRKFKDELISPEEKALRNRGASNAGYHYLGCAKTMGQIGKAFAEAMLRLEDS